MSRYLFLGLALCGVACHSPPSPTIASNALSAPADLVATIGNGQASLSWQAVSGATGYDILRGSAPAGPFVSIGASTTTTFTDVGLDNGTTYYYVVHSVSASAESGDSAAASATPSASAGAAAPPVPTAVVASAVSATEIDLAWTASAGATGYIVLRGTTTGGPYAQIATPSGASDADTSVAAGTTYFYVVRATNGSQSANSAEATASTSGVAAPTNLVATPGDTTVTLSWHAVSGASSYNVLRGTARGAETQVATATSASHSDSGLTNGQAYFYVVQSIKGGVTSGDSNEVEVVPNAASGWTLGQSGVMLSFSAASQTATTHASVVDTTLFGLTCVGDDSAWAVGQGGVLLYTSDGGVTWSAQNSGTSEDLFGVSFTSLTHGAVVGGHGTLLVTDDAGAHWNAVALSTTATLHGVKLSTAGTGAAVGDLGTVLWTADGGASWQSLPSNVPGALRGTDVSTDGSNAVAVGDFGAAYAFNAGGVRSLGWAGGETLYAVKILLDGTTIVAAGAYGKIFTSDFGVGAATALHSGTTADLFALMVPTELDDAGIVAVGAAGTIVDAAGVGSDFSPLASHTSAALYAIDDLPPR